MNSTKSGNNAIEYRDHAFRYDSETLLELEAGFVRELSAGKTYRQQRSSRLKRRKSPKSVSPGCGIASRCNRCWAW